MSTYRYVVGLDAQSCMGPVGYLFDGILYPAGTAWTVDECASVDVIMELPSVMNVQLQVCSRTRCSDLHRSCRMLF